jgi:hypothetical protein
MKTCVLSLILCVAGANALNAETSVYPGGGDETTDDATPTSECNCVIELNCPHRGSLLAEESDEAIEPVMVAGSYLLADCGCTREGECSHDNDALLSADESDEAIEPVMVAGSYLLAEGDADSDDSAAEPVMVAGSYLLAEGGEGSDQEVDDPQQVADGFVLAYAPVDQTRTDDVTRGPRGSAGPNAAAA